MFFVFGISNKEQNIDFTQTTVCTNCGAFGRLEVFLTYTYFSLFFIPIFKWNKKYYVRKTCCGSLYTIDEDLGKAIERGEVSKIEESQLHPLHINYNFERTCPNCNYTIEDNDFEYCPKCGSRLK